MKIDEYINAMNNVNVSSEIQNRILSKSLKANKKERFNMMYKKKIFAIAVAATFVLGSTVFAASRIISHWNSSSSSTPEYTNLPTVEQCIKDVGYEPCLIENFENGYTFDEGSVVKNSLKDDNNKNVEKFKSFTFEYEKNGDKVIFSQGRYTSEMKTSGEKVVSNDGIDIYYTEYTNKSVPANYKLTEEDKAAEANGEFVFSYGSDKVSISEVKGVSWSNGNMHYGLTQIDGSLSTDDFIQMAKEIMAYKK